MNKSYIKKHHDGYWIADTRVSLDSIVYAFINGQTAESIAQSFPVLTLEQVYGAVTFYLAHQSEVDTYLEQVSNTFEQQKNAAQKSDPAFYQKLSDVKRRTRAISE